MALQFVLILLQSTPAQAGTQKESLWLLAAQVAAIVLVIAVLAFIAVAMIWVGRESRAGGGSTQGQQDERSSPDNGSLYVVVLGISGVVFGFLVILLFADRFGNLSSALGFLTALFGAITGLVGTYFGVKSSSDARKEAHELAANPSVPPTVTVTPANATATVGTDHTVTATVIGQGGSPAAAVAVTFTVTAGPDSAVRPENVVTDPSGQAIFRFINQGEPGIDTLQAVALGGRGIASVTFTPQQSGSAPQQDGETPQQSGGTPQQGGGADREKSGP